MHKITPSVAYNSWLKHSTNQLIKIQVDFPEKLNQPIRKRY